MLLCCKSIVLGDSHVGKTTFLRNIVSEGGGVPAETIGIDFRFVSGFPKARVMLWDVSGRELFRPIIKPHYRNTHVVFFLYDVSKRASFLNIPLWYKEYQALATPKTMILVANQRTPAMVDSEEGAALAKRLGMRYVETNVMVDETEWVLDLYKNVLPLLRVPKQTKPNVPRGCFSTWLIKI